MSVSTTASERVTLGWGWGLSLCTEHSTEVDFWKWNLVPTLMFIRKVGNQATPRGSLLPEAGFWAHQRLKPVLKAGISLCSYTT